MRFIALSWPEPTPRTFVLSNPHAITKRISAYEIFTKLESLSDSDEKLADLALWRFACLCDVRTRREEARRILENGLDQDPLNAGFIIWALSRRYDFDRVSARARLVSQVDAGQHETDAVIAAACLSAELEGADAALSLLDRFKAHFDDPFGSRLLAIWRAQFGVMPEDGSSDAKLLQESDLPAFALIKRAHDAKDTNRLANILADENAPRPVRYEAAEALASLKGWKEIWASRIFLVDEVASESALHILSCAAANEGPSETAADYIEEAVKKVVGSDFPLEIRRYYAHALVKAGRLNDALATADEISSSPSRDSYSFKAEIYLQIGDLRGASTYIREAIQASESLWDDPQSLLRWANIFADEDRALAIKLLRHLRQTGYEGLEVPASFLALTLLPNECDDFMAAFYRVAEEGVPGGRLLSYNDAIDLLKEQANYLESIKESYWNSSLPIHFSYSSRLQFIRLSPFVEGGLILFTRALTKNAARNKLELSPFNQIILDITALFTIHSLDLWDLVFNLPQSLTVPNSIQSALIEMETEARPRQPDVVDKTRRICQLYDSGVVKSIARRPKISDAVLSDIGCGGEPPSDCFSPDAFLANTRELATFSKGVIQSKTLWLDYSALQAIVSSDQFESVVQNYRIRTSTSIEKLYRQQLREADIASKVADEVRRLRLKLSDEIRNNRIQLTAALRDPNITYSNQVETSVAEVLQCNTDTKTAIWIDDRHLNSFQRVDEARIISLPNILDELLRLELADTDALLDFMTRLRASGALFYPPTVSETVEALATAEVVDGVIIENRPLTELRRSFAALFVFDEYLSLKAGGRQSPGELNALMDAYRLGPDTIREICAGDSVEELKRAWMRWVLTAYKFETARRLPIENKSAASDLRLRASWLFSVLLTAFDIERILEPNFKEALSPLAHFLSSTLFERECDADGDLKSEVSEILSFFLLETIKGDTKDDERIGRALVTRYLDLLPKGLSDKILENTDIAGVTGYQQTVSFEGLRFSSEAFWEAAAQAVRRRDTVACASIDTEEVKISSVDQGIIVTAYGKKFRIDEPALRCLKYKSLDERRRHTAAELMQLGVPPKKSKRLALELSKEKKLSDYVFKFHDLISSNFQSTLSNLSNAAQSDDRLSLELFRPPLVDDLTDYLGFDEGALSFDEAASVLLKAVGVKEAVRRWLLLPVKLPSPLVDAYRREPEVRRNELLNGLTEQMCAPASLINLQMLSISSVCEDKTQLLRNRNFIHGATTNIPALYGLLSWNDACLRRSIGPKHWFHDLACWLWAGSVLEIFSINSSDISSLGEFLKEREPRGPAELPEILRIESQLNVRGYSDLSLSAVLIQAYGFDNIVSRDSNGLEKLKDYFRHDTTKEYPKISVFKLPHKKSDIEETWLSNRPTWVARAFETADGFVESALSEPENKAKDFSRKSKLSSDSKDSYFATLSLLAPYIDELGWKKIAQQLSRYRKKAGIKEIHTISRIIVNAPLNVSERLLEEFACRLSAIGPAENGATEAALAILESAVTASVRQPGDWAATFLPLAKALCRHLQDGFPMECVAVLDLSRWALPSASREELWRLRLDVAFLSDKRWHLTYLQ